MTDAEMTRLVAEAMGCSHCVGDHADEREWYWPLRHDAQALALVKRFDVHIRIIPETENIKKLYQAFTVGCGALSEDLNRAIVSAVALQAAKVTI